MYSLKEKKQDEDIGTALYSQLDKTAVLQEARVFHETPLHPKKCITILTKIISIIMRGEKLGRTEATDTFFAMTKLFQNNDVNLRRIVYLCIKEMSNLSDDVIIVTSSLTKDMNGKETSFRAPAIRALCKITDGTMIQAIERYMKQAIVDKNSGISSAALVSSMHLMRSSPEIIKRWSNEAQEAVNSDGQMPQYHGLGLLYSMRKADKLAVNKMVQKYSKRGFRSAHAQLLLVRVAARVIQEEGLGSDSPLFDFLESSLRHKSEMVIYEAARAIVNLPDTSAKELASAISVLQLFCSSPKPVLRYAAVRTLNLVSMRHPAAVTACNLDLEQMITDSNRHIATLAITTLLKTGTENSVERLLKQIATFMHEITDESKFQVVYALQDLVTKYPRKHAAIVEFLAKTFRDNSSDDLKKRILNVLEVVQRDIPVSRPSVYSHVCEFMEDLDNQTLSTRILTMLGNEGPKMPNAGTFVRFIYNRTLIDLSVVRSCAVSTLAKFAAYCDDLYDRIMVLLSRLRLDDDDEVRDRATFFYTLLMEKNKAKSLFYAFNDNKYDPSALEKCLHEYYHGDGARHTKPFEITSVPLSSVQPDKDAIARDRAAVTGTSTTRPSSAGGDAGAKAGAAGAVAGGNAGDIKSREARYHDDLIVAAPDLADELGNLFKASDAVNLTEAETEYVVRVHKLIYFNHLVLQFEVLNTLNDQLLENVFVDIGCDEEAFERQRVIHCKRLPYNVTGTTYVVYKFPNEKMLSKAGFECTLKFLVKDCDPESGEPDDMDGYPEEYELEAFELTWADNMQRVRRANFSAAWEEIGPENHLEETYALHTENIPDTVKAVVEHLGMQPCESSDKMVEGKSTHVLYLSGVFRGGADVVIVAKLVIAPGSSGVSMQMQLRSTDSEVSNVLADAIS